MAHASVQVGSKHIQHRGQGRGLRGVALVERGEAQRAHQRGRRGGGRRGGLKAHLCVKLRQHVHVAVAVEVLAHQASDQRVHGVCGLVVRGGAVHNEAGKRSVLAGAPLERAEARARKQQIKGC